MHSDLGRKRGPATGRGSDTSASDELDRRRGCVCASGLPGASRLEGHSGAHRFAVSSLTIGLTPRRRSAVDYVCVALLVDDHPRHALPDALSVTHRVSSAPSPISGHLRTAREQQRTRGRRMLRAAFVVLVGRAGSAGGVRRAGSRRGGWVTHGATSRPVNTFAAWASRPPGAAERTPPARCAQRRGRAAGRLVHDGAEGRDRLAVALQPGALSGGEPQIQSGESPGPSTNTRRRLPLAGLDDARAPSVGADGSARGTDAGHAAVRAGDHGAGHGDRALLAGGPRRRGGVGLVGGSGRWCVGHGGSGVSGFGGISPDGENPAR